LNDGKHQEAEKTQDSQAQEEETVAGRSAQEEVKNN
jgi:hypothetical protein